MLYQCIIFCLFYSFLHCMLHVIVGLYAIFVLPLYCRYFVFLAPKGHKSKQKRLELVCFDTDPEQKQACNIQGISFDIKVLQLLHTYLMLCNPRVSWIITFIMYVHSQKIGKNKSFERLGWKETKVSKQDCQEHINNLFYICNWSMFNQHDTRWLA